MTAQQRTQPTGGRTARPGERGGTDRAPRDRASQEPGLGHAPRIGSAGDAPRPRTGHARTARLRTGGSPSHLHPIGTATGRARVDAGGTRLRLRALHAMGHGSARIARATGASEQAIQKLTRGQVATVRPALRDAVAELYEAWWDRRPPEHTRYQRAAANSARRRARLGNWCAGAGLDDDHLNTPGYRPTCGWHPATGTGTASDISLPTPQRKAGIA